MRSGAYFKDFNLMYYWAPKNCQPNTSNYIDSVDNYPLPAKKFLSVLHKSHIDCLYSLYRSQPYIGNRGPGPLVVNATLQCMASIINQRHTCSSSAINLSNSFSCVVFRSLSKCIGHRGAFSAPPFASLIHCYGHSAQMTQPFCCSCTSSRSPFRVSTCLGSLYNQTDFMHSVNVFICFIYHNGMKQPSNSSMTVTHLQLIASPVITLLFRSYSTLPVSK